MKSIEALLQFCVKNLLMEACDVAHTRNRLFSLLDIPPEEINEELFNVPDARSENETASELLSDLSTGRADTAAERDKLEAEIMNLCMPRISEIKNNFYTFYNTSPKAATDYFYKLCRSANYIQVDRIKKDLYWTTPTEYGELEITVNLSKPEKDPKDIAAAKNQKETTYPRCLLCMENVGFEGTRVWPARQNLRVIPVRLEGENWYFQYSPYAYYNEHCIVLNEKHEPMRLTALTFKRLLEFVNLYPHYFIGSNADLPIVGGSILSHDHYQGGRHIFPMENASVYSTCFHKDYPNIAIALVKWPLSVIRLTALRDISFKEQQPELVMQMAALAEHILNVWRGYSDSDADVSAMTDGIPHNTVTPIVRYNKNGKLEMDLTLRNNRTSDKHPLGIFHPHAEWHHIKKENIGLIEVMGLAVLPGRLQNELNEIARLLIGETKKAGNHLSAHFQWIEGLLKRYGNRMTSVEANAILQNEIGMIFKNVLFDCGVFKDNQLGHARFEKFMEAVLR